MNNRKLAIILTSALLCASLGGCSKPASTNPDKPSDSSEVVSTDVPDSSSNLPAVDPDIKTVTTLSDIRTENSQRVFDVIQASSQFEITAKIGEASNDSTKVLSMTVKPIGVSFESICELMELPTDVFERDGDVYTATDVNIDSPMYDSSLDEVYAIYAFYAAIESMDDMTDQPIDFSGAQVYGPNGELLTPIEDNSDGNMAESSSGSSPVDASGLTHRFETTEKGIALMTDLGDGITLIEEYYFDTSSTEKINYMPNVSIQGVGDKSLDDINSYLTQAGLGELVSTDVIGRFDTLSNGTLLISSTTFNGFSDEAMYKVDSAADGESILKSFCD